MFTAPQAALKEANARLSNADGIWQSQNQRIATLEAELQQWRHQGPAKDLELQGAIPLLFPRCAHATLRPWQLRSRVKSH